MNLIGLQYEIQEIKYLNIFYYHFGTIPLSFFNVSINRAKDGHDLSVQTDLEDRRTVKQTRIRIKKHK